MAESQGPGDLTPPPSIPKQQPTGGPAPAGGANQYGQYDTSHSALYKQGNNINDAWSTSAPWRPEAPQGGAAGVYQQLASGAMNPLQQAAGYGYGAVTSGGPYTGLMNSLLQGAVDRTTTGSSASDPWLGNAMVYFGNGAQNATTPEASQLQGYLNMVNNGGYDAATKAAITNEGNNSITSQYEGLKSQLQNAAARTGSPLGEFAALAGASQNAGNQRNALARQNQILFANEAQRQKEAGLTGLGQNAGINLQRQFGMGDRAMQAQQARFNEQTQATDQANKMISDSLQRVLQGSNGLSQLAQALGQQQAQGAAGLAGLDQAKINQENQLYSILASILGTKQEDYTSLGKTTGDFNVGI